MKDPLLSRVGGLTFNLHDGKHFLIGGEGAGVFGNFYFGGFGYGGNIGEYMNQMTGNNNRLFKNSGGILLGGVSNTSQFFAIYSDMRFSWDSYELRSIGDNVSTQIIEYEGFSLFPSVGIALRSVSFIQLKIGAGYNYSGLIDDGGLENVPYNAPIYNFNLTFGRF